MVDSSSKPEKNFIRRRSLSITAATPGKTTSAADAYDEENLDVERNLTTLYRSVVAIPRPSSLFGAGLAVGEERGRRNHRRKKAPPWFR